MLGIYLYQDKSKYKFQIIKYATYSNFLNLETNECFAKVWMIYFLRKLIWFSIQRVSKENTGTFGSFGPFSLWDCILQKCLPLFQALNIEYSHLQFSLELFYLNSTLNFGIPKVLVFQLEVYYKADRLLSGLTAQQKGTTARRYSNKTSLPEFSPKLLE